MKILKRIFKAFIRRELSDIIFYRANKTIVKTDLKDHKFIVNEDGSVVVNKDNEEVRASIKNNIKALATLKASH